MDRELIAYEVKEFARLVTDSAAIAYHINRVHRVSFTASDIDNIKRGFFPEVIMRQPVQIRVSDLMEGHLPLSQPLTTLNDNKIDPLFKALAEYHAKRSTGKDRLYWERLAA